MRDLVAHDGRVRRAADRGLERRHDLDLGAGGQRDRALRLAPEEPRRRAPDEAGHVALDHPGLFGVAGEDRDHRPLALGRAREREQRNHGGDKRAHDRLPAAAAADDPHLARRRRRKRGVGAEALPGDRGLRAVEAGALAGDHGQQDPPRDPRRRPEAEADGELRESARQHRASAPRSPRCARPTPAGLRRRRRRRDRPPRARARARSARGGCRRGGAGRLRTG